MYNGIINIYKEKGFTSHDVVAKLRGILKQKKIGHTGTLDPDATGVLPVCLGKATKLCDMLTEKEKAYKAVMILGRATDTQDITGTVTNSTDIEAMRNKVSDEMIKEVINSFVGEYSQIPPMYSAIKVNGKKLYELARKGIEIERQARNVFIYKIENISINYPEISMEVHCSKGTYIRTLCHDIGLKLDTYACMTELERIKSGIFMKETAITLEEVEKLVSENKISEHIIPIDSVFNGIDKIAIKDNTKNQYLSKLLYNGNSIPLRQLSECGVSTHEDMIYRVYDCNDEFIGIYRAKDMLLKPEKLFLGK